MNQNLGKLDRILRFALAFWWLGPWAPQFGAEWGQGSYCYRWVDCSC